MVRAANRRQQISEAFEALCASIGRALGAADARRDAAVAAHAQAMAEMWLRTEGLEEAAADPALRGLLDNPGLAAPIERIEADRRAAFTAWLESGPERLAALMAQAAPGVAGGWPSEEPFDPVGRADAAAPVPGLWYAGQGRIGDRPKTGFPVGLPLLDESHLQVHAAPAAREPVEQWLQDLLLRLLCHFRPGLVRLHLWDVGSVTGTLPGLYPLTRSGLLTVHDPSRLPQLLDELADRIRRVHTRVLADGHASLRALAAATGEPSPEPWVVAVLIGNRSALREEDHRQLQRVARGGLACGVVLVLLDLPASLPAAVETVQVGEDGRAQTSMTGPHVRVELASPRPLAEVTDACHRIAAAHEDWCSRIATFQDLLPGPGQLWCDSSSAHGLSAPIGFVEGRPVPMVLGDSSPHALIGGPSGSGKTNLLLTMISSLAVRYSPWEVEFYLLDFKEGVSFAQFAPGREASTWLPHARLIGVNVNTDREFGLALLQFLSDEMRRRATEAKRHGVSKLAELRAADPNGYWPRMVAVIDEFQFLFADNDPVGKAAAVLLEDVARRGRSQGIHLVLASQDTSGIQAFWGRPATFEQFVLRIALPRARRVLAETNDAAVGLPRWHAVLNHESGTSYGNQVVRIPDASAPGLVEQTVQGPLHQQYGAGWPQPRVFDGNRAPRIGELVPAGPAGPGMPAQAVVGRRIAVSEQDASVPLTVAPGRNLGVLATLGTDAIPVLELAAAALAPQYARGTLNCVIAPLVREADAAADRLVQQFSWHGQQPQRVALDRLGEHLTGLAREVEKRLNGEERDPVLVVLFAADAAEAVLERPGTEALRTLLHRGPETGIHVLGWWRSIQRLRTLLTMGAAADDLGALVALDVRGAELGPLLPGMSVGWAPRPGRGLFFDRAQHTQPEVIIVPVPEAS